MVTRLGSILAPLVLALLSPIVAGAQHFASDEDLTELIRSRVEEGRAVGIVLGVVEADGSTRGAALMPTFHDSVRGGGAL